MSDELLQRLIATSDYEVRCLFGSCLEKAQEHPCESPIETLFLAALISARHFCGDPAAFLAPIGTISEKCAISVVPQYEWRNHRIDFALFFAGKLAVFVECDGHDFHERTKEQAERDRSRDREIQSADIIVMRFTGREIWRDPFDCVGEALEACDTFSRREPPK